MVCPKCENPADEFYSGVPGVICRMVHGRIAGKVKACQDCKRFPDNIKAMTALMSKVKESVTWLEPEEKAYAVTKPRETRRGRALWPDGKIRAVYAGVPDTFFSVPAHGQFKQMYIHGWLTLETEWVFHPDKKYELWFRED